MSGAAGGVTCRNFGSRNVSTGEEMNIIAVTVTC